MKIEHIFSQKDKLDIEKEIASIERVTSGEIVPFVVDRSSDYRTAGLVTAIVFGYVFVFAAYEVSRYVFWKTNFSISEFIIYNFIGILVGFLFMRINFLKRMVISNKVMHHKVHEAAFSTFYQQGVNKTKDKTGILIYISVFERQVVVLGDEGINSKVKDSDWNDVVSVIVSGIKGEHLKQGVIDGIESCRSLLQTHFPVKTGDVNELPNRVIIKNS